MKVIVKASEFRRRLRETNHSSIPTIWYRGEFFELGQGAHSVKVLDRHLLELDLAPRGLIGIDSAAVVRLTPEMVEQPGCYFVRGKEVVR